MCVHKSYILNSMTENWKENVQKLINNYFFVSIPATNIGTNKYPWSNMTYLSVLDVEKGWCRKQNLCIFGLNTYYVALMNIGVCYVKYGFVGFHLKWNSFCKLVSYHMYLVLFFVLYSSLILKHFSPHFAKLFWSILFAKLKITLYTVVQLCSEFMRADLVKMWTWTCSKGTILYSFQGLFTW